MIAIIKMQTVRQNMLSSMPESVFFRTQTARAQDSLMSYRAQRKDCRTCWQYSQFSGQITITHLDFAGLWFILWRQAAYRISDSAIFQDHLRIRISLCIQWLPTAGKAELVQGRVQQISRAPPVKGRPVQFAPCIPGAPPQVAVKWTSVFIGKSRVPHKSLCPSKLRINGQNYTLLSISRNGYSGKNHAYPVDPQNHYR